MPFPTALTSQQKTNARADNYRVNDYILATPQDIVFQATVADAITDSDYALLSYDTPSIGSADDLVGGQTVLVHSDANDIDSLRFPPTYVRSALSPELGQIAIGWQATDLQATDTITVLNDYRLHVRQPRATDNAVFIDYDRTYTPLPPNISGLQSVYVENSSSAVSFTFTPTTTPTIDGLTISSFLWNVADGTITSGSTTTKDITVSFPAYTSGATSGWRYVSFQATDSAGTASVFHFQVFVGDLDSAEWVIDSPSYDISSVLEDGFLGQLTLNEDASTLYRDNHITIVIEETKNGDSTPVVSNIAFVGRKKGLVDDVIAELATSDAITIGKTSTYEIQSYGAELQALPLPEYQLENVATVSDWNDVSSLSIARGIWYILVNLTTAPLSMVFDLDFSTWNAYQNNRFSFQNGTVLESINRVGDLVGARMLFASSGEALFSKAGSLLSSTDRNALPTIMDFVDDDIVAQLQLDLPDQPRIGRVLATGAGYSSATGNATLLQSQAPKIPNTLGENERQYDLLLETDATDTELVAELSVLSGNYLAFLDQKPTITLQVRQNFWFLVAHNAQWYTLTYSDFQSGTSYDTTTRWIAEEVTLSMRMQLDEETGVISKEWTVNLTLTQESQDVGVANSVTFAPPVLPYAIPQRSFAVPNALPYDPDNAYDDDPDSTEFTRDTGRNEGQQPLQPTETQSTRNTPNRECLGVPLTGAVQTTNRTMLASESYVVTVQGFGQIGTVPTNEPGTQVDSFSLQGDEAGIQNGNTVLTSGQTYIVTVSGVIQQSEAPGFLSDAQYSTNTGQLSSASIRLNRIELGSGGVVTEAGAIDSTYNSSNEYNFLHIGTGQVLQAGINDRIPEDNSGSFSIVVSEALTEPLFADAFYQFEAGNLNVQALASSQGLFVNGGKQVPPSSYKPNHTYQFERVGTGDQETYEFNDTDFSDNSGSLSVCIEGTFG